MPSTARASISTSSSVAMQASERLADGYRQDTDTLAAETSEAVGTWWDRTEGLGPFAPVAAAAVAQANRRAVGLADRYLADVLTLARGEAVTVFATDAGLYVDGRLLRRSLSDQPRHIATVVARNEPLDAGRAALRRSMPRHVARGVRQGGTCPICSPKNGTIVPADADVSSHKGCACVVVPIV